MTDERRFQCAGDRFVARLDRELTFNRPDREDLHVSSGAPAGEPREAEPELSFARCYGSAAKFSKSGNMFDRAGNQAGCFGGGLQLTGPPAAPAVSGLSLGRSKQ